MGGKAILLVVISFSMIFSVVNFRSVNTTSIAVERLSEYYATTNAQNIASSAANIAANEFFKNPNWTGYSNDTIYIQDGYAVLDIDYTTSAKAMLTSKGYFEYYYEGEKKVNESLVTFKLNASSYSKFGYYAKTWGSGYLVTGDTIDGPFHTQDQLNTLGSPVFLGKVTTKNGVSMVGNKYGYGAADPKFLGGYDTPVDVPLTLNTSELETAASSAGRLFEDPSGFTSDIRLKFNSDGTVDWSQTLTTTTTTSGWVKVGWKWKWKTTTTTSTVWTTPVNATLDTLAPNGVIWNKKGNLYLSGTVNGKYTVGTAKNGSAEGYVYLEDDIVYRKDPMNFNNGIGVTNPLCQDMLGIVAEKQVVVKDNAANRNDINIHAAIFNYDGGITVENISSSSANMGTMRIHGSLIEDAAKTTGYTNGAGYNQVIKYDRRYMSSTPPKFPATQSFEIVSWFE
jgi:hypothetical protein